VSLIRSRRRTANPVSLSERTRDLVPQRPGNFAPAYSQPGALSVFWLSVARNSTDGSKIWSNADRSIAGPCSVTSSEHGLYR
jgi:hypothetical protein